MTGLRWEKMPYGESWGAYSGDMMVGSVVKRAADGRFSYRLDAVHTKHVAKGFGETKAFHTAKIAVDRAWSKWLARANLTPKGEKR